ncbi:putative nucleic acid-binding protein [Methanobrevibacter arboriphilus JCM 13429 = DSM 1125]|uniref:Putative nucleic acid-binding protein n=1 Tax=Methanobrevibacter arboriphilus JCM 13429 = DSM 1125 TaxID=1300164 RepID=A0A1V6N356_METAZ|nr:type II toxin-antitoxin system VapC family toxin [Methanobrevibacter arboriphilus]OQD59138.1 putative nucleic acid-binding protein [Methanobrevibacter arboriphilus JCM 13429 = DSM 1125]
MIFLDANFLINLYVETNNEHERANEIYNLIENEEKIISNLVIMEVITVMNIKLKLDLDLISEVYEELNIAYKVLNDTNFYNKGFDILKREFNRNKEKISLFDCVYVALMKDLGIEKIATFDDHFDNIEGIVKIC